jgi:hypothetical protein
VPVQTCIGVAFSAVVKRPGRVVDQSYLLLRLRMSGPKRLHFLYAFKYCTGTKSLYYYPQAPKLFFFSSFTLDNIYVALYL